MGDSSDTVLSPVSDDVAEGETVSSSVELALLDRELSHFDIDFGGVLDRVREELLESVSVDDDDIEYDREPDNVIDCQFVYEAVVLFIFVSLSLDIETDRVLVGSLETDGVSVSLLTAEMGDAVSEKVKVPVGRVT